MTTNTGSDAEERSNQEHGSPNNNALSLLKSIFSINGNKSKKLADGETVADGDVSLNPPLPFLSTLANSVASRCSKILHISLEELQNRFVSELPDNLKQPSLYARNFLEYCSYETLCETTKHTNYLGDNNFRRLTFDMMLAWEAPSREHEVVEPESSTNVQEGEDDGRSIFYSSSTKMAVEVDDKKTIGAESFARIAPACVVVADIITVGNLFVALTCSSGHRLHFLVYEKYLRSLEKVIKAVSAVASHNMSNLSLMEDEVILDVDGIVPTQPVFQHIGLSAWPGRLSLSNHALYFEPGVGLYDKALRYDLAIDIEQVIKPELTGPLGARIFDKAVMYKSSSMAEPVCFEFPEFKGSSRRDYWLDICLEVLRAHKFIRRYNLTDCARFEALARALLGILRYRAVREAFHVSPSNYNTLLCFNLAESLPGGDAILETLSNHLVVMTSTGLRRSFLGSPKATKQAPVAHYALHRLGILSWKDVVMGDVTSEAGIACVGETHPLEAAVKMSRKDIGRAEAAQETIDRVKVEGIDSNLAVMQELLFPLLGLLNHLKYLASWKDPWKSVTFLMCICYATIKGCITYVPPSIMVFFAVAMLWRRLARKGSTLEPLKVNTPPPKNAVEQLLTLQEAVAQVEALIQGGNIVLLKVRALLFAVVPQATDKAVLLLLFLAVVIAFAPLKQVMLISFLEHFTRQMPLRRNSSEKFIRRIREWWSRIPAAPVQLIKLDDKKRK
ncbi:unnamed protein product [Cuscuta europaea]|uniref:DUF639 domain-containing protein n=1 Tax=Cuscuta europaea TaxID=41803 RepID=A0A9P0Z612_CUSEU|nr:unnamed protein product [Cuscuta europaea]